MVWGNNQGLSSQTMVKFCVFHGLSGVIPIVVFKVNIFFLYICPDKWTEWLSFVVAKSMWDFETS